MSDHHAKYGKEFLGKLLTVVLIPVIVYYCVKKPQKEQNAKRIEELREENRPIYQPFDPFKEEREKYNNSLPTQLDLDSLY